MKEGQDTVLLDRVTHRFRQFQRGDVVFFETETGIDTKYIIGKPNETIQILSGRVWVNGEEIQIKNFELPNDFDQPTIILKSEEYYAVVTNPDYSNRNVGEVVSRKSIRGQYLLRLYPFDRFGLIR